MLNHTHVAVASAPGQPRARPLILKPCPCWSSTQHLLEVPMNEEFADAASRGRKSQRYTGGWRQSHCGHTRCPRETRWEGSEARRLGAEFKLSYHLLLPTGTVPGSAGWVPSALTLTDMLARRQQCEVRVSKRSPSHRQVTWA